MKQLIKIDIGKMEHFFYCDKFISDIDSLLNELDIDEENIKDLPDDWEIICEEGDLEPVFQLSADWILDRIDEERFSEDGDEPDKIADILKTVNFDIINSQIPKLYYESYRKFKITKQDLMSYMNII